tara:strand:+ start:985 stop:1242 length:258 start_codon:yes stop_codon:yes gene_type:complete
MKSDYLFIITRHHRGVAEYSIMSIDNSDNEIDQDEAEWNCSMHLEMGWELLSEADSIRDADDFINCCIDIDEMVGGYGEKGYRTD